MTLIEFFNRHPRRWAIFAAIVTLAAVPFLFHLEVNNSIEVWIDRDGEAFIAYQEFLDAFGSDEYILVIYRPPPEIDLAFIERLADLKLTLEEIPGIQRAQCLSGLYARFFGLLGIEAFRQELRDSPLYRDFLISADSRTAAVWLGLDGREQRDRGALVTAVRDAIRAEWPAEEIHLAGSPVVDEALDAGSQRSALTLFPLVFLLSAILLYLFFQRPYGVIVPCLSVGSGIFWTLALMAVSGHSLNMVTVTLPPLLWVLGLSTSIHLLSRGRQLLAAGVELDDAIRLALTELARPCLLSAVTTALGFGSLMTSSMRPVREMGFFAALGILLCLASNFMLFSWLARRFPPRPRAATVEHHPVLAALGALIERRAKVIVTVAAAIAVLLLVSIFRLRAESNVITFFKPDAPIAITYEQVLAEFTGPYSVEVLVTPEGPVTLDVFRRIDRLSERISTWPGVAKVLSAADFVKKTHQRASLEPPDVHRLPDDEKAFAEAWDDASNYLGDEIESFYDAERGNLRLSVIARPMSSDAHLELVTAIRAQLDDLDPSWQPRLTGIVPLLVDMQERLLESQIRSIALAFLLIGPVIALLLRSRRYAILSLAPNLAPIVLSLGTMGLFDIALDPATVMIAGIALGIGVDDTIHFLVRYLQLRNAGSSLNEAMSSSLQTVGRAMVRTSTVAALGFFVLCFSEFRPLLHFGLFTGIAMVAALVSALVILPALLLLVEKRGAEAR